MYVRIKHHKRTYFIECASTSTVGSLKPKLLAQAGTTADVKLHIAGKTPGTYNSLEDAAVLEQVGIVDEQVLYAAFWVAGEGTATGSWEAIAVPEFEPLVHDDDDAIEDDPKGKGKASA
ncbi:hypothetical protein HDU86_004725 [Geranomyces michiganensis]|nr:hypothetical protein HDU86_004725 [Geranomyces michiganensis]